MPTRRYDDVRKDIAAGKAAPVYLLVGDDDGAVSALVDAFSSLVEEDLRPFNHDRFHATDKGVTPDAVAQAARTLPMMSPRRLVVLLRAEKWLKPKRRGADVEPAEEEDSGGELGALEQYVAAPEQETTLVFVAADVDKGRRLTKALYKQAVVVEAWGLKSERDLRGGELESIIRRAQGWIDQQVKAAGRTIDPDAARLIAERAGADMGQLRADLERLLLFTGDRTRLTRQEAEEVVSEQRSQDKWAVANAIERGDAATGLRELALALDAGTVPYLILGQLAWVVRERLPRVNPAGVPAAVNAVFRTDLDIKSSAGDPRVLLERLIVELCDSVPTGRRS
jgi:DNA polymerase III subunit delta